MNVEHARVLDELNPLRWLGRAARVASEAWRLTAPVSDAAPARSVSRIPVGPQQASTQRPEQIQALMDGDVNIQLFTVPTGRCTRLQLSGATTGFELTQKLHRFEILGAAPANRSAVTARSRMGEAVGTYRARWLIAPDAFDPGFGREPPPTTLNLSAIQNVAVIDSQLELDTAGSALRAVAYGTFTPVVLRGRRHLQFSATGHVFNGTGRFAGQDGVLIYTGILDPDGGFKGSISIRLTDSLALLRTHEALLPIDTLPHPDHGVSWLRLGAGTSQKIAPAAEGARMTYEQDVRLLDIDFSPKAAGGPRCTAAARQVIGNVKSVISMNTGSAAGTPIEPLSYSALREFSFIDAVGAPAGSFRASWHGGYALRTRIYGAPGVRLAGAGSIVDGTGRFSGMQGTIAELAALTPSPYAVSSVYTLRVPNPTGRFFSREGVWREIPVDEVQAPAGRRGTP